VDVGVGVLVGVPVDVGVDVGGIRAILADCDPPDDSPLSQVASLPETE